MVIDRRGLLLSGAGKRHHRNSEELFVQQLLDHAINLQYRTVDIDYVSYVSFASIYYNCSTICHSYTCKAKVTFALKYAFPTRLLRCKLRERRNCFWSLFLKYLIYIKVCLGKSSPHEWRESLVIRLRTVVLSYHRHIIWPPTINKIIAWCWWLGYRWVRCGYWMKT